MDKNISTAFACGVGRSWFGDAIIGAWKLARIGIEGPVARNSPLYGEVCALTAPHLPVLVYRRAKFAARHGAPRNPDWQAELDSFAARELWPNLSANPALQNRNRKLVVEMLDDIVDVEQDRVGGATADDAHPYTSRFDTSWAI